MVTWREWVAGARPRTLPAAVSPVLAGTGAAAALDRSSLPRALLALVVALALQVGVNYANDYSDGIRGTDAQRVGPLRLVGSGLAEPGLVKRAAFAAFGVAAVAGLVLVALSGLWWLLLVGVAAVAAAWWYTGGRNPYGYRGLGEVAVFTFFGLVAVGGTELTQAGSLSFAGGAAAVGVGLHACALLVANNLRDLPTDTVAGKRTLEVRLGAHRSRQLYRLLVLLPFALDVAVAGQLPSLWPLLALAGIGLAVPPMRVVSSRAAGPALIPVLRDTGRLELVHAALLALGLALAG